jgi:hypothetical protein
LGLPLLGPGLDELEGLDVARRAHGGSTALLAGLEREARSTPTLLVLDLPPARGVVLASRLARMGAARPVLLLGRWPHARAILPARPLLGVLLAEARRLPPAVEAASVALVLDGERSTPLAGRGPTDPRTDNRYVYSVDDLPDPAGVLAEGIRRVLDVRLPGEAILGSLERAYSDYRAARILVEPYRQGA